LFILQACVHDIPYAGFGMKMPFGIVKWSSGL